MKSPYIEFIGPPGAGKSTIANALIEEFKRKSDTRFLSTEDAYFRVARENIDSIYRPFLRHLPQNRAKWLLGKLLNRSHMHNQGLLRFLASHEMTLNVLLSAEVFMNMAAVERLQVLEYFFESASIFDCCQTFSNPEQWIIYDEGILQKSYMFVSPNADYVEDSAHRYLVAAPKANIVISVNAPADVCQQRMASRIRGVTARLKEANVDQLLQFYANAQQHHNTILNALELAQDTAVINVNSVNSIEAIVKDLYTQCSALANQLDCT